MAKSLPLYVLYFISTKIIFLEKNATRYHWLKLFLVTIPSRLVPKVSWLNTTSIAYSEVLVSI